MMSKCGGFSIFACIVIFAVLLQESRLLMACGVGKGSYANKEYPPFSKYQQKPERDEESAIASGPFNHKLRFGSRQFKKDIIRHMDTNIVFRDDEGNGYDRYMTRRCSRALKRLAQYVRIKWNNRVKVRVIEAWDEDGEHSPHSLHYEGRAIDITTSDRDRTKYGTLASLAYYKAEFDWVTFLDGHVHVSCKRDDVVDERNSCFPATGTVITENGSSATIDQLKIGDKVLAQSESGTLIYSRVVMFMDHKPDIFINNYVVIEMENPLRRIELTKRHLIFASKANTTFQTIFAEKIKPGDLVKVLSPTNSSELITAKVTKVSLQRKRGAFAPLTEEGTILVNGVLASCYALTENQNTAHMSFLPWRKAFDFTKHFSSTKIQTGLHWYVRILRTINRYLGALPEIYAQ